MLLKKKNRIPIGTFPSFCRMLMVVYICIEPNVEHHSASDRIGAVNCSRLCILSMVMRDFIMAILFPLLSISFPHSFS